MSAAAMVDGEKIAGDAARWEAVLGRDREADGLFVYGVKTTGVYCRPWCGSRQARRGNVEFFGTVAEAERAGYRACKRCRPDAEVGDVKVEAVARACRLMERGDVSLGELARAVGMGGSHFQRVFKEVTGLTPKRYAMGRRGEQVRGELMRGESVMRAVYRAGFGSSGRFYAGSSKVLGMKAGRFRAGGAGERIRFAVGECSLGAILVGATEEGICLIALGDDAGKLVREFEGRFARAERVGGDAEFERWVAEVVGFVDRPGRVWRLPLDVRGTVFQQRVWRALSEIPCGERRSYSALAERLGVPGAVRAVARACAANPAAVAIPCHRIVRRDGGLAGYRWGVERKEKLLRLERTTNQT